MCSVGPYTKIRLKMTSDREISDRIRLLEAFGKSPQFLAFKSKN